jgi:AcrR family transcriptional regulator
MAVKQRARRDADKVARRRSILAAAARMLRRRPYDEITMAEVATRCGLAKGTLYLYFPSKEELFLAALLDAFEEWFRDLAPRLEHFAHGPDDAERLAELIAGTLAERPTMIDLIAICGPVLERNIEESTALEFKTFLRDRAAIGGASIERVLGLRCGAGGRLLLRIYALVLGLRQMSDPAPAVARVLARPELAVLRVDFRADLADTIADMVHGMRARARAAES